jgi:hypothetical protein
MCAALDGKFARFADLAESAGDVARESLLADVCALDPPLRAVPLAALPAAGGGASLARMPIWSGAPPCAVADLRVLTLAAPAPEPGAPPRAARAPHANLNLRIWSCDGIGYASHALENGGRRDVDVRDLPFGAAAGGSAAAGGGHRAAIVCAAFGDLVCEWRENPAVEARLAQLYAQ